jgi:hypothetical protein
VANGAWTLGEFPLPVVRLSCAKCDRRGQYRTVKLLEQYSADMSMPELRHVLNKPGTSGGSRKSLRSNTNPSLSGCAKFLLKSYLLGLSLEYQVLCSFHMLHRSPPGRW